MSTAPATAAPAAALADTADQAGRVASGRGRGQTTQVAPGCLSVGYQLSQVEVHPYRGRPGVDWKNGRGEYFLKLGIGVSRSDERSDCQRRAVDQPAVGETGIRRTAILGIRSQVNEMHLHRAGVAIQRMLGGLMEVELKEVISYAFDNDMRTGRNVRLERAEFLGDHVASFVF